jgi:hypothetical protein
VRYDDAEPRTLLGYNRSMPIRGNNTTPTSKYITPSTPQNVLANLKAAYETRDSVEYKTVYDSSYTGTSTDNAGGGGQVLTFTYSDEIGSLANMARSSTISSVTLDLGGNLLRQASDDFAHPEYAIIMTSAYRIEIIDGGTYYTAQAGSGDVMQFTFKPRVADPLSPTDTLWTIIRWTEVSNP